LESLFILSLVFGILSMVFYGFTSFFDAILTKKHNTLRIVFWFYLIGSVILTAIGFLVTAGLPVITPFEALMIVVASIFGTIGLLSFYKALDAGRLSIVAPVTGGWSIVTVVVGIAFLGETLNMPQALGIILIIVGTILVSFKLKDLLRLRRESLVAGSEYAILTLVCWGLFYSFIGILSKDMGWIWPAALTTIGSTIIMFLYMLKRGSGFEFPIKSSKMLGAWIILGTAAIILYSLGAKNGYISIVGPLVAAAPFISLILARIFLKERLNTNQLIGIAILLIGIIAIAL
jgi:uncharacterized membrane protein